MGVIYFALLVWYLVCTSLRDSRLSEIILFRQIVLVIVYRVNCLTIPLPYNTVIDIFVEIPKNSL